MSQAVFQPSFNGKEPPAPRETYESVKSHCEKSRGNRDDKAIPEELDCFAEFILSVAEGLAMTKRRLLTNNLRLTLPSEFLQI